MRALSAKSRNVGSTKQIICSFDACKYVNHTYLHEDRRSRGEKVYIPVFNYRIRCRHENQQLMTAMVTDSVKKCRNRCAGHAGELCVNS